MRGIFKQFAAANQRANGGVLFKIFQHLRHAFLRMGDITQSTNQPQGYGILVGIEKSPAHQAVRRGTGKQPGGTFLARNIKAIVDLFWCEANNLFNTNSVMMRIGSGNHSQRAAKHRVNAISQNHHIRFENIIPGLDASDLVSFTNQRIDAYARDKLRARLLGLFHQPRVQTITQYGIRCVLRNIWLLAVKIEGNGAFFG